MKKILAIAIFAVGVLGAASGISMAANMTSGQSDIPRGFVKHLYRFLGCLLFQVASYLHGGSCPHPG